MTLSVDISHAFGDFTLKCSFEAGPGITALFGRSGAGKTTVINAVAGLLHPDDGQISIGGEVVYDAREGIALPAARRRLGYVFQDARLFPHLSAKDNLTFGARYAPPSATGPSFEDVTDLLGLGPHLDRRPGGLSGGEKQRVALGRALLSKPRMLLMDEPLASLDGPRKQDILPYLENLRDGPLGLPILYVSHSVEEVARLADTLVLLKDGQVAAHGPLYDVMADPAAVPLLGARDAGAVLLAEVSDHAEDGISTLHTSAGAIHLPGVHAPIGSRIRLRVKAQDVMIATQRPEGLSALNVLPVTVESIFEGEGPGAAVGLRAGEDRLIARLTSRAVKELGLAPGTACFAILKATSVAPGSIGR